jgi:hypothetical protein
MNVVLVIDRIGRQMNQVGGLIAEQSRADQAGGRYPIRAVPQD